MQCESRQTTEAISRHDRSKMTSIESSRLANLAWTMKAVRRRRLAGDMTAPGSAGRGQKVPRPYVFRCASDVADLSIWLGKCPQERFFGRTEADRLGTKMGRRQKSIGFTICFEFCTLIARSMTSEKKAVFHQITWGRAVGKRLQNEPQKALHEAVCEASERRNRAVAAVALI